MPSCSQRASTGGACWRSGMWRLRMSLANSSPGASGDTARPNYMGPSGNGLVERMKAGETPWNQGRSNGRPCPFPEGGPEDEGKTPQWGAARRAGPRYGPAIPSADGRGHAVRQANGRGVPRPRISALRFPLFEAAKGSNKNLGRQPAGMRRAATLPHGSTMHGGETTMPELQNRTSAEHVTRD